MLTVEHAARAGWGRGRARRRDARGALSDLLAVVAILVLVGLGALNLYAVAGWSAAAHQLAVVAAGLVALAVLWGTRIHHLTVVGWACYGVSIVLKVAVLAVGSEVNGARRWLDLGSITVQPSELAKLGLLLVLADILSWDRPPWRRYGLAILVGLVPFGLTAAQPDLSTAILFAALTLAMLVLGRMPLRVLLPPVVAAPGLAPLVLPMLEPYQLARLQAFFSPLPSITGSGYAAWQAHIAIASGSLTGPTPLSSLLAPYLPGRETDLAIASLVEQWGLVAGAAAVVAVVVVIWRVALASRAMRTRQGTLTAAGFAVLLGLQVGMNVAGNLGLAPIAGIPFPLLSYGGTVAVVYLAALGIILGARRHEVRRRLWFPPPPQRSRPRFVLCGALALSVVLAALSTYGFQLNAHGVEARQAGEAQMQRCARIPAPRGLITDRHGTPLGVNDIRSQVLGATPLVASHPEILPPLAELLGLPLAGLRQTLTDAEEMWVPFALVDVAEGRRVEAARLPGIHVIPYPVRRYPYGPLFGPLLGFVGVATPEEARRWPGLPLGELVGRAGIEQQYDPVLRGVDGEQCVYVDPLGQPVALAARRDPVPGTNLRLSIDLGFQQQLTAALAEALQKGQRRGDLAGAVALDPRNGQVLAMASLPAYDNNLYGPPADGGALHAAQNAPGHPTLEHVTQVAAPPGSAFKVVVAAADMVHLVIPPERVIPTGGSFTYGGHTFGNWRGFGPQNLVPAIAWSNNVYFYKLAAALGPERITEVAGALGVGQPTGIDLPAESGGYLGTPGSVGRIGQRWYPGSTIILGIGQGYVTTTPLQGARWIAALATGRLVTPRLGLAVDAGAGGLTALPARAPVDLPFADRLGPVREGLRQAVLSGTAGKLRTLPVPAGAKTGTAQDPASPNGATDAWMLAVAPLDDPVIAVASFVRGGGYGSATSGPVVRKALEYLFGQGEEPRSAKTKAKTKPNRRSIPRGGPGTGPPLRPRR